MTDQPPLFDPGIEYPTKRQQAILELLVHDMPPKKIALTLKISTRTVKSHIHKMKAKAHVDSQGAMVYVFMRAGILK